MEVVELQEKHWQAAAALVAARVRRLRMTVACLPRQYEEPAAILPLLRDLAAHVPGVAAFVHGRIVGFLLAMSLPTIKGKRGAFSPEWANGAHPDLASAEADTIYQALYAALSPRWLANGCYIHAVRVLADDHGGVDGLYRQGFGCNNVDAIRDLRPLAATASELTIRRATVAEVDEMVALGEGLQRHLAAPPIYLPYVYSDSRADYREWLTQPQHVQWLAYRDGAAIAEMRREPTNFTACAIAADRGTAFITSAYTVPPSRSSGVAAALLSHLLEDACVAGCERCATDFESANLLGARFWLHHFQPVAYTVLRYIDERVAFAHAERRMTDFW